MEEFTASIIRVGFHEIVSVFSFGRKLCFICSQNFEHLISFLVHVYLVLFTKASKEGRVILEFLRLSSEKKMSVLIVHFLNLYLETFTITTQGWRFL